MALQAVGFLLLSYLMLSAAMYFQLGEQEEKCIIEEIPEDTLVKGHFLLQPWNPNMPSHSPHLGVTVTVKDQNQRVATPTPPSREVYGILASWNQRVLPIWNAEGLDHSVQFSYTVVMSKRYGKSGKFTFTAHISGQHYLCFQTNSTRFSVFAAEKMKLHLDVQMGEHIIDPSAQVTKDNLEVLEESLMHMREQMTHITRQQEYQREKEELFRLISEDTNSKVLWWAVVQASLLLCVGFWQMKRLKDFFISKKLV